ncbi:MAG: hypothetical protein Q4D32_12140 [Eubacteriales bacterium]|nr:hypothetical protein [Eubacteriales bacterium]
MGGATLPMTSGWSWEYYYVKNCSLWMDALTVIKTAVVILKRDGAK